MTLYELLTRRLPFCDLREDQLANAVCVDGERPNMDRLDTGQHPEAIVIMQQCWSAQPEDRPTFEVIAKRFHELAPSRAKAQEHKLQELVRRVQDSKEDAERKFNAAWDAMLSQGGEDLLRTARELTTRYPDDDANPPRQPATVSNVEALHEAARESALPLLSAMRSFADMAQGARVSPAARE